MEKPRIKRAGERHEVIIYIVKMKVIIVCFTGSRTCGGITVLSSGAMK